MTASEGRRSRSAIETHDRIVNAALDLFSKAGYGPTSIDQIAEAAGIGRRTFFRYFPSKEAVLFSELLARQRWALQALGERPSDEPPLESLLAVFRALCKQPVDAVRWNRVNRIVLRDPELRGTVRRVAVIDFEDQLVHMLLSRKTRGITEEAIRVLTSTALACVESAWRVKMTNGRTSLVSHFDAMVKVCAAHWGEVPTG